jgi:hypothetical protein
MDNSTNLAPWLIVWMVTVTVTVIYSRRESKSVGTGLVLAYLLNLWLLHWVATSLYLLPWYQYYDTTLVEAGLVQSTYGILAFAFGSLVLAPAVMQSQRFQKAQAVSYRPHPDLPKAYMVMGAASYALLSSLLGQLPTANALTAVGQQLFVVGLCLTCWQAWWEKEARDFTGWCGVVLLLPFITIVSRGFIGYGAVASLIVLTFIVSFVRLRLKLVAAGLVLVYLGLSFYVSYMRDRSEIREVVWGGQPLQSRIERVFTTLSTLEWFDPWDESHLLRVDQRLNQNFLAGVAVHQLSESGDYAYGETIWQALMALIPRALWPEKPVVAGSMGLVSRYTGIPFAEGTSVGIGQVMEFYINFGTMGVVLGFLILGVIITLIDSTAAQRLLQRDWQGFALWYLVGISFLQVGGSLVEVTSSAGASVAVALLANRYLLYRFQRKRAPAATL